MQLIRYAMMLAAIAILAAFWPVGVRAQQATSSPEAATGATPTNPPLPSPKPTAEEPRIHKLAVQQFLAWQTGTVDRNLYSERVNEDLTDDVMDRGTKTLANLGGLQKVEFRGVSVSHGVSFYVYRMMCQNGSIQMEFALDPDGKIGLIFFE